MNNQNQLQIAIFFGGGSQEHSVSVTSSNFIAEQISKLKIKSSIYSQVNTLRIRLDSYQSWLLEINGTWHACNLESGNQITLQDKQAAQPNTYKIDFAIPCFHGPPGETGEFQALLKFHGIPFLGSDYEGHLLCFNKIQSKLLLSSKNIPVTPFNFSDSNDLNLAIDEFNKYGEIFIKSSHQGSSIGCHYVKSISDLQSAMEDALNYSPFVLFEKPIKARELEVAVYEIGNTIYASEPGEIICPGDVYSYEEKYLEASKTNTNIKAILPKEVANQIKEMAIEAFRAFHLQDLARVDFFYSSAKEPEEDKVLYLNEINTFPGLTPISMFPVMAQANGHEFYKILESSISKAFKN